MTEQDVLDKVWNHFVTNKGSRGIGGPNTYPTCLYKLGCVIGIFIPQELYKRPMEGFGVKELIEHFPDELFTLKDVNINFLIDLQEIHDKVRLFKPKESFDVYMREELTLLSMFWNLKVPTN